MKIFSDFCISHIAKSMLLLIAAVFLRSRSCHMPFLKLKTLHVRESWPAFTIAVVCVSIKGMLIIFKALLSYVNPKQKLNKSKAYSRTRPMQILSQW